jgi:hypothetical protein
VTTDTELEAWRREWHSQTEPLPELRRKIRRQNLRIAAVVIAIGLCLALSTAEAWRSRSWFMAGLAAGIGFASLLLGGFGWWVRRGTWRPTAQTTLAYVELSYRRAVAKSRTIRFSFYFMLAVTVLFTAFAGWRGTIFAARGGAVAAAMVAELFFLGYCGRQKRREIEATKRLIDDMKE